MSSFVLFCFFKEPSPWDFFQCCLERGVFKKEFELTSVRHPRAPNPLIKFLARGFLGLLGRMGWFVIINSQQMLPHPPTHMPEKSGTKIRFCSRQLSCRLLGEVVLSSSLHSGWRLCLRCPFDGESLSLASPPSEGLSLCHSSEMLLNWSPAPEG